MDKIDLVKNTIDNRDIDRLVDWLKGYPRLTKGELNLEFEKKFANWIGRKYAVFCNSGSSANLLMLSALNQKLEFNLKSVVVPSVAWATDLAPVMELGFKPILCDSNKTDLSVDLKHLEKIFIEEKPSALILVSVLGFCPNMDKITKLCEEHDVILLEDTCESLGSEFKNKKLGTFGKMSSFSTYFGHHISTIEGGIITTDDKELYDILVSIRSHGWGRDWDIQTQFNAQQDWDVGEFDSLYTFYYSGYNLRATEIQAFLGIHQIDKLDDWGVKREKNLHIYDSLIKNDYWKVQYDLNDFTSNFAYPIIHPNRESIVELLIKNGIETRPMICGSMGTQPFYVKKYGRLELPNVTEIDKYGFYVPNHPRLKPEEIEYVCDVINARSYH
ncbi:MAG: hypothetical protein CBE47_00665 [Pelagibacteraceae bacterium TMED287]|nr:MAG: hypothetical protein CBE47_00665 [Pelagibacteraceae bacterium TMED287]